MSSKFIIPIIGIHAIFFTLLFHQQSLALNLFIYEMLWLGFLAWRKELPYQSALSKIILSCVVSTSIALVLVSSQWVIAVNMLVMLVFLGNLIQPKVRSVLTSLGLALNSIPISQIKISEIKGRPDAPLSWFFRRMKQWYIFIIPIIIIVVFVLLYSGANQQFGKMVTDFFTNLSEFLGRIFKNFELAALLTLLIGVIVGNIFLFRTGNKKLEAHNLHAKENLERRRYPRKKYFPFNGLRRELRAAIFLLISLNLLLALFNVLDIQNVWLKTADEQKDYAQSVHEGIYLLITSILISIALVLYYFRANLNFYKFNTTLKILAYIWLLQNALLVISAGVRNYRYIEHCALAYKRIGVWIFLAAVLIGLLTVLVKVQKKKTGFYLFRTNSLSVLIILVISSFVNWDIIIARYNLSRTELQHFDNTFLLGLSDKAIPYLELSPEIQEKMKTITPDYSRWNNTMLDPESYLVQLSARKKRFIQKWENYTILEWNYPEYQAYKQLKLQELALKFPHLEN